MANQICSIKTQMGHGEPSTEPWSTGQGWKAEDFANLETPCFVVDEKKLEHNMKILKRVQKEAGCKILLALKGFSMFSISPLVKKYLAGTEASSIDEARLGCEEFSGETHTFSPAYTEKNIAEYIKYSDHLIFNSFSQWKRIRPIILKSKKKVSCGLRVNPEHCEAGTPMYDPCGPNSRLGIIRKNFEEKELDGIEGLHYHNLCQLNADAMVRTLESFEEKFKEFLPRMKWMNFGGGHHITRGDYDVDLLIKTIKDFKKRYPHLEVYLEPGEAVGLNAGVLVTSVADIIDNGMNIAILDFSAAAHVPDILEMPYKPTILGADTGKKYPHVYRLGGPSCLAGDVIGNYTFKKKLAIGDKLIFLNMAIYTMVKTNTFNGIRLPSIFLRKSSGKFKLVKKFSYEDFKGRLS
ncbi:MAG: carboxynorspermidine decarboxylase [Candidatus Paceibacterota bacterium]|jgi:carboxynorspermidine decarboxylase